VDLNPTTPITLADYIYPAIQTQYIAIVTHEAAIIDGGDLHSIHQMRVSLRRLRSIVRAFTSVVDIPKPMGVKQMGEIAKVLGKVRDLDIIQASCKLDEIELPTAEQMYLNEVQKTVVKRRRKAIIKVQSMFEAKEYQYFKLGLNNWLNHPQYTLTAQVAIVEILPNLILPVVGQLFLDPGWWLDLDLATTEDPTAPSLQFSTTDIELLHQLRKRVKATRYLMELFLDRYGFQYSDYLKDLKQIHQLLGALQDRIVLDNFMHRVLGKRAMHKLPTFYQQIDRERQLTWEKWQPIQHKYRQSVIRQDLQLLLTRGVIGG
jgi:CHAD domain-containing protein